MSGQGGSSLDRIARDLASGEFSRRTALRRLAGATLAAAIPGVLLADTALGGGDCTGQPDDTPCPDFDVCNGAETCQGGVCVGGTALNCDDNNPCTTNSCDAELGCQSTNVADGTACNQNGGTVCTGGSCVPGPVEPETTITRDPGETTSDRTPKFKFKSVPAGATFECSIDGSDFKTCESPHTTKRLSIGRHKFKVRATLEGVTDATPAKHQFKVVPQRG